MASPFASYPWPSVKKSEALYRATWLNNRFGHKPRETQKNFVDDAVTNYLTYLERVKDTATSRTTEVPTQGDNYDVGAQRKQDEIDRNHFRSYLVDEYMYENMYAAHVLDKVYNDCEWVLDDEILVSAWIKRLLTQQLDTMVWIKRLENLQNRAEFRQETLGLRSGELVFLQPQVIEIDILIEILVKHMKSMDSRVIQPLLNRAGKKISWDGEAQSILEMLDTGKEIIWSTAKHKMMEREEDPKSSAGRLIKEAIDNKLSDTKLDVIRKWTFAKK